MHYDVHALQRRVRGASRRESGFTLIEIMIAIAIVGILTAIALPQYNEYVRRSKIIDATSGLNDFRTRMEQYFQDNRSYADGGACGVANPADTTFQIACTGAGPNGYTLTATGLSSKGMGSFVYTMVVDAAGLTRDTTGVASGWTLPSTDCWAVRKNGDCS